MRMMRMIGLIGGMSWESSAEYYRVLHSRTPRCDRFGPLPAMVVRLLGNRGAATCWLLLGGEASD